MSTFNKTWDVFRGFSKILQHQISKKSIHHTDRYGDENKPIADFHCELLIGRKMFDITNRICNTIHTSTGNSDTSDGF
jgi:hypothetical protein